MFTLYVIVVALTSVANTFSATCDFTRFEQVAVGMREVGVPESWMNMLGGLKVAGAIGVVLGLAAPPIGIAAAVGLILFFLAAIATHLRVRDHSSSLRLATVFLSLAVATLVLNVVHQGG